MTTQASRRAFLRATTGLAAGLGQGMRTPLAASLAGLGAMASLSSQAADTSGGYKALVCLFLNGGSDSHNWVVPTDPTGYQAYAAARAELAWPLHKLLPISAASQAAGRSFGMPEELAPLRKWYDLGKAAIVANVGPLVRPLTRAEAKAGKGLPPKLFSHNDQASAWQSLSPEGARSGWGGRMGDILMAANAYPVFTAVSATGNAVFLSGGSVNQFQVGLDGPVAISGLNSGNLFGSTAAPAALQRTLASQGQDPLQTEYTRVLQRGISSSTVLQAALPGTAVPAIPATAITLPNGATTLDKSNLARQLRMVAQMAGAGQALGMRRQIFMVSIGGFDSHANQMRDQPLLMGQVAQSVDYFMTALSSMNLLNNVTLFTASDFGRTLLSNGDGSDHGWGGHHLVVGGAVAGGNIHGRFPDVALGAADDVGSGRLLPAYSVGQLAAPMGRWMGLSAAEVAAVLPGLGNFDANALQFI